MGGGMRMTSPPMAIACSLPSIPTRSSAIVPCLEGPVVGRGRGVILWQAARFIQDSLCKLEALCKSCRVLVAGFE